MVVQCRYHWTIVLNEGIFGRLPHKSWCPTLHSATFNGMYLCISEVYSYSGMVITKTACNHMVDNKVAKNPYKQTKKMNIKGFTMHIKPIQWISECCETISYSGPFPWWSHLSISAVIWPTPGASIATDDCSVYLPQFWNFGLGISSVADHDEMLVAWPKLK